MIKVHDKPKLSISHSSQSGYVGSVDSQTLIRSVFRYWTFTLFVSDFIVLLAFVLLGDIHMIQTACVAIDSFSSYPARWCAGEIVNNLCKYERRQYCIPVCEQLEQ